MRGQEINFARSVYRPLVGGDRLMIGVSPTVRINAAQSSDDAAIPRGSSPTFFSENPVSGRRSGLKNQLFLTRRIVME
jgi:hypothetical protein